MNNFSADFKDFLNENNRNIKNNKLYTVIQKYSFHHILEDLIIQGNENIYQKMNESKVIFINKFVYDEENSFLIIGFKETIIIVELNSLSLLSTLFSNQSNLTICFLQNVKDIFSSQIKTKFQEIILDQNLKRHIKKFNIASFRSLIGSFINQI